MRIPIYERFILVILVVIAGSFTKSYFASSLQNIFPIWPSIIVNTMAFVGGIIPVALLAYWYFNSKLKAN